MRATDGLRQVKHAGFVLAKRSRFAYRRRKFELATAVLGPVGSRVPHTYRPGAYATGRGAQPWLDATVDPGGPSVFPRRLFLVWSGDNPLTPARRRNLGRIEDVMSVETVLVTPENLGDWVTSDAPLHEAYDDLSAIHRSDYLRGYLMHHHGGGYLDIKEPLHDWAPSFDRMSGDEDCWVTSYPTTDANWIGKLPGRVGWDILLRHRLMFGKSGFLMRARTPLTAQWLAEMDRRLDARADELRRHPGGVFGDDPRYPVSWTDLLGRVLDPLTLKYADHVRYDDRMLLRFEDYR